MLKILEKQLFSGRICLDWGNKAQADTEQSGSIELICHCSLPCDGSPLMLTTSSLYTAGLTETEEKNCALLERAINEYVRGSQVYENIVYGVIIRKQMIWKDDIAEIQQSSDLDFNKPSDVKKDFKTNQIKIKILSDRCSFV